MKNNTPFLTSEKKHKAIEEICGKSTWRDSFSRLAVLRIVLSKKQKKHILRYGPGLCVYLISGLYRTSFGQEFPYKPTNRHIHKWINEYLPPAARLKWIFLMRKTRKSFDWS